MSTLLLMCADGFSLLADEPSGHIPQGLLDRARPIGEPLRCGIMGKPFEPRTAIEYGVKNSGFFSFRQRRSKYGAASLAIFNGKHTGRYIRLAAFPTICSILRMVT